MKEPSKIKDVVVGWNVDSEKVAKKSARRFPYKESTHYSVEDSKPNLYAEMQRLFYLAYEEEFEDGYETFFSRSLISLIKKYGNMAVEQLSSNFLNEEINPEIIAEALRWIGRMEHPETYANRRLLLENCLFCDSPYIRDGALLGIAAMNDPDSIRSLKLAIAKENISELCNDMNIVLSQLESDGNGISFENYPEK